MMVQPGLYERERAEYALRKITLLEKMGRKDIAGKIKRIWNKYKEDK